jgi:hypothetical protein
MKPRHACLPCFFLFALIFLPAGPAESWTAITNPPSVWTSLPVPYYVNNSGCADIGGFDAAVTVCETSYDTWENNDCTSWQVNYLGGTDASPSNNGDSVFVQGWLESGWRYGSGTIGVTMDIYWGGRISGFDIQYNAVNFTWSTTGGGGWTVDAQSIVTHEEGHSLGLDHPACTMQQTMCASYSGGTAERTLTSDDIDGVCTLYPGTGPQPECATGADCEDKYECVDGTCVGQMCAKCAVHDDCGDSDDYCLGGFVDGLTYCGASCATPEECGTGNSCFDLGGGIKQCLPVTLDCSGAIPDCTTSDDCPAGYVCEGGFCVPAPPPTCTTNDDCNEGYICVDGFCAPDTRPHLPVCSPCASDDDCGWDDDRCITLFPDGSTFADGLSYCGVSCSSVGGDCGPGFTCMEFGDKPKQCLPSDQACRQCDPVFMMGCDPGYFCDFMNCSTGFCRPGEPGLAGLGEKCDSDLDCESLQCVKQVGGSYCSAACIFGYGYESCYAVDERMTCQPLDFGMCGYCSCDAGRLGDLCSRNADCQSGGCLTLPNGSARVCSMYCGGMIGCPSNFECQLSAQEDAAWGCFPASGVLKPGDICDGTQVCIGGWCATADNGAMFCTRSCEGDCKCPINMHCGTSEESGAICMVGEHLKSGCGCVIPGEETSAEAILPTILFMLLPFAFFLFLRTRRKSF